MNGTSSDVLDPHVWPAVCGQEEELRRHHHLPPPAAQLPAIVAAPSPHAAGVEEKERMLQTADDFARACSVSICTFVPVKEVN